MRMKTAGLVHSVGLVKTAGLSFVTFLIHVVIHTKVAAPMSLNVKLSIDVEANRTALYTVRDRSKDTAGRFQTRLGYVPGSDVDLYAEGEISIRCREKPRRQA